jgi:hypothetical protein
MTQPQVSRHGTDQNEFNSGGDRDRLQRLDDVRERLQIRLL